METARHYSKTKDSLGLNTAGRFPYCKFNKIFDYVDEVKTNESRVEELCFVMIM